MAGKPKTGTDAPQKGFYYPELDGLRFFAFLLVFLHHHPYINQLSSLKFLHDYGWIGVDVFFVLSSFLLTRLLFTEFQASQAIQYKKFYIRRIYRIWPLYFFFTFLSVGIYLMTHDSISQAIWWRIAGLLGFSDNIFTALQGYNPLPYAAHLWTITYEEQFYLLIPFMMFGLLKTSVQIRSMIFASIFISLSMIRYLLIQKGLAHPAIWVLPFTHFESMAFGVVLGFGGFEHLTKRIHPLIFGFLSVAAFAGICLLPNLDHISNWLMASYLLSGLATTCLFLSVYHSKLLKKIFGFKLIAFLGKRSYGLYIYHMMANELSAQIVTRQDVLPRSMASAFWLSLFLTIVISIFSYMALERPFLKLKYKFEVIHSRPV